MDSPSRTRDRAGWKPGSSEGLEELGPPSVGLEGGWEVGRLQELWIVPAEPDVVGGVNTEAGDILQEDTCLDSWFAVLVE